MIFESKAAHAESLSRRAFGASLEDHQRQSYAPYPVAYISEARRIVERPTIIDALARWDAANRKARRKARPFGSPTGRKPVIGLTALLIIMLMHVREGRGVIFTDMAATLTFRMNAERLRSIGIAHTAGTFSEWYARLHNAKDRLEELVDYLPGSRKKIPTFEQYARILEDRERRAGELTIRKERLDWLMNQLVESSVRLLGKEIRDRYVGNVALDATKVPMIGRAGMSRKDLEKPLKKYRELGLLESESASSDGKRREDSLIRSISYDAGAYVRAGSHDGTDHPASKQIWSLELELATMTANKPGEPADFPLLVLGVSHHVPGAIKLEAKRMFDSLARRGYRAGKVFADMAYLPNAMPEELQGPLRDMGRDVVFDYKSTQLGQTDHFEDAIQVEGQWYVRFMPEELQDAVKSYRATLDEDDKREPGKRLTMAQRANLKKLRDDRRPLREPYRLKPKGRTRPDGSQQFMYPDPAGYIAYDPDTGEVFAALMKKTVVIPREAGLKHAQKYVHKSDKWKAWYSLRNTVEAHNSYLKDAIHTDLEAPGLRRARGNTFAYIVITLVVVAANIRKIWNFLHSMKRGTEPASSNRHERLDSSGFDTLDDRHVEVEHEDSDPPPQ